MKYNFYILLIFTTTIFSQVKIDRDLGEFSKVAVYDGINLELIKSDENKVEIRGKNTAYVVVKNKNGDLKVRLNLEKRFSGERTKVTLFYKTLYNIISHEGSNIFSKDTIKQADINIKANTGSTQNFVFNINTLNTTAASGANINVSGKTEYHDSTASTGAKINAQDLLAEEAYVSSTSGAVLNISVAKELEANSRLGGIINVYKKTEKITETISLGGVVNYLYDQ
tara:strand:- start:14646 stop:15323 length:678 start_codon:yes stop_codon:yes gene_type:complete